MWKIEVFIWLFQKFKGVASSCLGSHGPLTSSQQQKHIPELLLTRKPEWCWWLALFFYNSSWLEIAQDYENLFLLQVITPWSLHMAIVPKFLPYQSHHDGDQALSLGVPGRHPNHGSDSDRILRTTVTSTCDWAISRASLNNTGHRWWLGKQTQPTLDLSSI